MKFPPSVIITCLFFTILKFTKIGKKKLKYKTKTKKKAAAAFHSID